VIVYNEASIDNSFNEQINHGSNTNNNINNNNNFGSMNYSTRKSGHCMLDQQIEPDAFKNNTMSTSFKQIKKNFTGFKKYNNNNDNNDNNKKSFNRTYKRSYRRSSYLED